MPQAGGGRVRFDVGVELLRTELETFLILKIFQKMFDIRNNVSK